MPRNSPARIVDAMPEAFVSNTVISREVSRRLESGQLRKLGSRLYTTNFTDAAEAVIRRNLWQIVAGYFPGALIADRTALENEPAPDGSICLVTDRGGTVALPGITLRPRRGVGPLPTDRPFLGGLFLSSTPRAYLDNLRPSRARAGRVARTLPRREIESRLENLIQRAGMDAANRLRDEARTIAPDLGRDAEALLLDDLIGAMAGTREAPLTAPTARARRRGRPYDPARLALFEKLHAALRREPVARRRSAVRDGSQAATLAFYDAYFSNFIEGTEFTVDEARDIVFRGRIPAERPADAHDIAGVWRVVSDPSEMRRVPRDAEEFLAILRSRHATILQNRPDVRPGEFKLAPNRAGATIFVRPEEVTGTLEQGFALYRSLETAFERAAFLLFLIGEVHPFSDGNGRLARIMMNAELVRDDEERVVIPTVFRGDYLAAMRALTHNGVTEPLIRMLDYAQRWTAAVDWRTVEWTARQLASCNAFLDSDSAEREGLRLRLPHGVESRHG